MTFAWAWCIPKHTKLLPTYSSQTLYIALHFIGSTNQPTVVAFAVIVVVVVNVQPASSSNHKRFARHAWLQSSNWQTNYAPMLLLLDDDDDDNDEWFGSLRLLQPPPLHTPEPEESVKRLARQADKIQCCRLYKRGWFFIVVQNVSAEQHRQYTMRYIVSKCGRK